MTRQLPDPIIIRRTRTDRAEHAAVGVAVFLAACVLAWRLWEAGWLG